MSISKSSAANSKVALHRRKKVNAANYHRFALDEEEEDVYVKKNRKKCAKLNVKGVLDVKMNSVDLVDQTANGNSTITEDETNCANFLQQLASGATILQEQGRCSKGEDNLELNNEIQTQTTDNSHLLAEDNNKHKKEKDMFMDMVSSGVVNISFDEFLTLKNFIERAGSSKSDKRSALKDEANEATNDCSQASTAKPIPLETQPAVSLESVWDSSHSSLPNWHNLVVNDSPAMDVYKRQRNSIISDGSDSAFNLITSPTPDQFSPTHLTPLAMLTQNFNTTAVTNFVPISDLDRRHETLHSNIKLSCSNSLPETPSRLKRSNKTLHGRIRSEEGPHSRDLARRGRSYSLEGRKRRRNEWNDKDIVVLLQITKLMVDCELKSISKALFECIERPPGKSYGRAAEKKLKRMDIFENWKTCNREEIIQKINDKLREFGELGTTIDAKCYHIAMKYRNIEIASKTLPK